MALNEIYLDCIIDMSSNNNFVQIPTMQGDDKVRGFKAELISNGVPYIIDKENVIAAIGGTKSDSTEILNECDIIDENHILVEISAQMSAVQGRAEYCIILIDKTTSSQLKSFPFYILTTEASFEISDVVSSDEFQLLAQLVADADQTIANFNDIINKIKQYKESARISAETATESAANALESEQNAFFSATSASASEESAQDYATKASINASKAEMSADNAKDSENNAKESENNAEEYANTSKSYAVGTGNIVRENDVVDNAKYYYEQAKGISEGLNGALLPMGTIVFENLEIQTKQAGFMYNISNSFITTNTFKEGAGHKYPEGTNVYYTADGHWDCFAGTMVTSVNGQKGEVILNYTSEITSSTEPTGQKDGDYWNCEY